MQQQMWAPVGHLPPDWQVSMLPQAGHVPLGKQLSDPPSGQDHKPPTEQTTTANLHRKLQRQLTLNPTYDPRLFHLQQG